METLKEFRTVKALIENLMETEERCRNDDKYLTYRVFEIIAKNHGHRGIFIPFDIWDLFPAFETVKRTRAHIQNKEGRLLPTDEKVKRKRKRREVEVYTMFRDGSL